PRGIDNLLVAAALANDLFLDHLEAGCAVGVLRFLAQTRAREETGTVKRYQSEQRQPTVRPFRDPALGQLADHARYPPKVGTISPRPLPSRWRAGRGLVS